MSQRFDAGELSQLEPETFVGLLRATCGVYGKRPAGKTSTGDEQSEIANGQNELLAPNDVANVQDQTSAVAAKQVYSSLAFFNMECMRFRTYL